MEYLKVVSAGLQLALLRGPAVGGLRLTPAMFWLLSLTGALLAFALGWLAVEEPRAFSNGGIAAECVSVSVTLIVSTLLARALGHESLLWPIAVLMVAAGLVVDTVVTLAFDHLLPRWPDLAALRWGVWLLGLAWWTGIVARILGSWQTQRSPRQRGAMAVAAIGLLAAVSFVLPHPRFWQIDYRARYQSEHANDPPPLIAEQVFTRQPQLLDPQLAGLAPGVAGTPELYFMAFGPYGAQDVFLKEAQFSTQLFQTRFGLQGRTLMLVNNRQKIDELPLASVTNLRLALNAIGARMNRDEDILFLFLTSHGSPDAELSVTLDDLTFAPLTADVLAGALRDSGIRWKVLLVSGCYSGSFIDALKDDHAMVITAARKDRTSFGCSDGADFTWFGRAYFEQALGQTDSFADAFARARALVDQWETREGYIHSEPQIATGALIEEQLARWRATLPPAQALPRALGAATPAASASAPH